MMRCMSVVVNMDPSNVHIYRSDKVLAVVYVDVDGEQFPGENWTDFVFWIISNWLRELREVKQSLKSQAELVFFDGPFEIRMAESAPGSSIWSFALVENDLIRLAGEIELEPFRQSLVRAAKLLVTWAKAHSVEVGDITRELQLLQQFD